MWKRLTLAALAALMVVAAAVPASAEELTTEQREKVVTAAKASGATAVQAEWLADEYPEMVVVSVSESGGTTGGVTTQATSSKTAAKTIVAKNAVGGVIWTYKLSRYWTYNGVRVLEKPPFDQTVYIAPWAVGWDFEGAISNSNHWINCSGNHANSCHYRKRQSKFQLVLEGILVQTELPAIWMTVYHSGGVIIGTYPG